MADRSVNQIFDAWADAETRAEEAHTAMVEASREYRDALAELDSLRAELSRVNKVQIRSRRS